jgi:hypothetical protein
MGCVWEMPKWQKCNFWKKCQKMKNLQNVKFFEVGGKRQGMGW